MRGKHCPYCGHAINHGYGTCTSCGANLQPFAFINKHCPYCGRTINLGDGNCPSCGSDLSFAIINKSTMHVLANHHQLPPGTVLQNTYVLRRVLGEGGFGITYEAFDQNESRKVAIKEYFPVGYVTRNTSTSRSVVMPGDKTQIFAQGKAGFIEEARMMARMSGSAVAVDVLDLFSENGTAYIVMEYVEGTTLAQYTKSKGGRIPTQELLDLLSPVFEGLGDMHAMGLVHRDISPDNIMIDSKGRARLIDFGCAREGVGAMTSMTVMLKFDYAPLEQYDQTGQGPWTDVYALCATIYECLCGTTVPQATARASHDTLVAPTQLGASLTPAQERGLLRGLSVLPQDRTRTIGELQKALYSSGNDKRPISKKIVLIVAIAALVLVAATAIVLFVVLHNQ